MEALLPQGSSALPASDPLIMEHPLDPSTGTHPRLLVVDDDPGFRRLCSMALEEAGIRHVSVGSSREALRVLEDTRDEPFDLLLLDMELPGMKGWELLEHLRDQGDDIPVVFVTVMEALPDKVKALDLGADDYVVKPFAFDELLSRLQAVLRRTRDRGAPSAVRTTAARLGAQRRPG